MKTPRFKPVRTAKGWRLNIPAALSSKKVRARRFFRTREAADAEAARLRARVSAHGLAAPVLPPAQSDAAARAFVILGKQSTPEMLIEAAREYVQRHNLQLSSLEFEAAFAEYASSQPRSASYAQSLRQYRARLKSLHGKLLCDITSRELESAMEDFSPSVFNYGLRILGGLFTWGFKRDLCASNPLKKIDRKRLPAKEIEIYTPDEVERLLSLAEPELIPWLAVCLFAGLRGSEARQLRWGDFNFEDRVLRVRSTISKIKQPRTVAMEANLEKWLIPFRQSGAPLIAPQGMNVLRSQLRCAHRAACVRQIKHGPRHSYGSYHLAQYHDIDLLRLNMGHEVDETTFRHYAAQGVTKSAAKAFWAISPQDATNVVQMASA